MSIIYLDHNATTTPIKHIINEALDLFYKPLNPSSIHIAGKHSKNILDNARKLIATSLKANCHDIIFASSATEANNLIINQDWDYIITSPTEHDSIFEPAKTHHKTFLVKVDANGIPDLDHIKQIIAQNSGKFLISLSLANNETGVLLPPDIITQISILTHEHGGFFHSDTVQYIGKEYFDFTKFNLDAITISSHKIGGIFGCGALILSSGIVNLKPMLIGGGQESFKRSSTHNLPAIHIFSKALEYVNNHQYIQDCKSTILPIKHHLEDWIKSINGTIFCQQVPRLANTTFFAIPNVSNKVALIECDLVNIAISNGSACSSGSIKFSRVLQSINTPKAMLDNAIRISLAQSNRLEDITKLINTLEKTYNRCNP